MTYAKNENAVSPNSWEETRVKIHTQWGRLSHEDIESSKNDLGLLLEKIQAAYGYSKNLAQEEYDKFIVLLSEEKPTSRITPLPKKVDSTPRQIVQT